MKQQRIKVWPTQYSSTQTTKHTETTPCPHPPAGMLSKGAQKHSTTENCVCSPIFPCHLALTLSDRLAHTSNSCTMVCQKSHILSLTGQDLGKTSRAPVTRGQARWSTYITRHHSFQGKGNNSLQSVLLPHAVFNQTPLLPLLLHSNFLS
jgi:hypothetical protein